MRLPNPDCSQVVLIGSSAYRDPDLPDLDVVRRSVHDLARRLSDPQAGIVPSEQCRVVMDATDLDEVGATLVDAAERASDLLLVYYAGHGLVGGRRNELFLGMPGSRWRSPEWGSLKYETLQDAILDSAASVKALILDCCFSGRALGHTMADPTTAALGQLDVEGTFVLASASRDKVGLILEGEPHTAFTGRLLSVLDAGIPSGGALLSMGDIYQHLRRTMRAQGLTLPEQRGSGQAWSIALARNAAYSPSGVDEATRLAGAPAQDTPWPPETLADRYRLGEILGKGGYAEVFSALDLALGRSVALKLLRPALLETADTFLRDRFLKEVRAMARVSHPAIVTVYDVGFTTVVRNGKEIEVPWIVSQLVRGRSLRSQMGGGGTMPLAEAIALLKTVLGALSHGHALGFVHRGIEPASIMLADDGRILLKDFGIGHVMRDAQANLGHEFFKPDPAEPAESEDGTGAVSGSIRYMAPESALGDHVDGRSDLYSAACLLFELVTGRPPFEGDSPIQVVYQHVKSPPPRATNIVPGLPRQLDQILEIGLAKDPGVRFQTADDFAAALAELEDETTPRI